MLIGEGVDLNTAVWPAWLKTEGCRKCLVFHLA